MKEFNAEEVRIETASALETVRQGQAGGGPPESRGEIANKPKTVAKLVERLNPGVRW